MHDLHGKTVLVTGGSREIASAEDVANLVVLLASGAARHMAGGTIDLNGASYTH